MEVTGWIASVHLVLFTAESILPSAYTCEELQSHMIALGTYWSTVSFLATICRRYTSLLVPRSFVSFPHQVLFILDFTVNFILSDFLTSCAVSTEVHTFELHNEFLSKAGQGGAKTLVCC